MPIRRIPTSRYIRAGLNFFIRRRKRLFSIVGAMLERYIFSMTRGTDSIAVGRTFLSAGMSIDGVGGFGR